MASDDKPWAAARCRVPIVLRQVLCGLLSVLVLFPDPLGDNQSPLAHFTDEENKSIAIGRFPISLRAETVDIITGSPATG